MGSPVKKVAKKTFDLTAEAVTLGQGKDAYNKVSGKEAIRKQQDVMKASQAKQQAAADKRQAQANELDTFKQSRAGLLQSVAQDPASQRSTLLTSDLGQATIRKKTLLGG